ncbi:SR-rich pre-mRNA splicing activator [Pseudozyma hubeiensis SY62]|uniref:SR-rich pre-mRNA splicing activator n=1 Tax=Pseudozyma hubeiensis (strain SY62) TaxID=1305764 RepID=R9NVZ8_PSEHS|nr:SR-rich pre-mRNA splicing activator [Pseudozyma hubeiensis SY62]GAC92664.1 SR-rich pre-mRNA splicing activator [Pseudozyma hubeiensis SY62]
MGDSSYKGVSAAQDSRFTNKESTLLRKLRFPASFDTKVDTTKVELSVIKPWISQRITSLLGFEDDVVLEYASGMLEEERFPDPRKVQIQLMGFLEGKTAEFMEELWGLLISAQESPGGVPRRFVEEKKEELRLKREEGERVVREARERARVAAEAGGRTEGGQTRRRSRWDAGATSTSDGRPPAYTSGDQGRTGDYHRRDNSGRNDWNRRREHNSYPSSDGDRDRYNTDSGRARDSGWGNRAPRDTLTSSHQSSRRSPSPPPRRRRRSPSLTPPRQKERQRSRSRSITPDYRSSLRERKQLVRDSPRHRDRDSAQDDSTRRVRRGNVDDADERDPTRRRISGQADTQDEAQRERELRDKLMRAKASRRAERE